MRESVHGVMEWVLLLIGIMGGVFLALWLELRMDEIRDEILREVSVGVEPVGEDEF